MADWATNCIRYAVRTGKCPMCQLMPRARWPNGDLRITCGRKICLDRWLPGSREIIKTEHRSVPRQEDEPH